jgi:hypothetical protein
MLSVAVALIAAGDFKLKYLEAYKNEEKMD